MTTTTNEAPTVNVFDYEQATELPVTLPMSGAVNINEVALAIATAEALGKAVVIWSAEDADGKEIFTFYAIDRAAL